VSIMRAVGLPNVKVLLNSLGDAACRPVYRERVRDYFGRHLDRLCEDDRERWKTNPLRILDCKIPACQPILAEAPSVLDALCDDCRAHFAAVQEALRALGIDAEVAPRLVRGLDYYTRTVFEVHAANLGAQSAVGGGGRYDQLVQELGGPETPSIGFSIGTDRLHTAAGGSRPGGALAAPDAFVVARQPEAASEALIVARALRGVQDPGEVRPLRVLTDVQGRSASSQMKVASRVGAKHVVFVPRDAGGFAVRDMVAGKDEMKQPDLDALRIWLRAHRAAGGESR
ncbi:MAG: ATP phosphoribosyltransferase regulatory subunit, partial [Candidatus Eisenbacteria bacterium]